MIYRVGEDCCFYLLLFLVFVPILKRGGGWVLRKENRLIDVGLMTQNRQNMGLPNFKLNTSIVARLLGCCRDRLLNHVELVFLVSVS